MADNQTPVYKLNRIIEQPLELSGQFGVLRANTLIAQTLVFPESTRVTTLRGRSASSGWIFSLTGPAIQFGPAASFELGGSGTIGTYVSSQYGRIKYGYGKGKYGYYSLNGAQ